MNQTNIALGATLIAFISYCLRQRSRRIRIKKTFDDRSQYSVGIIGGGIGGIATAKKCLELGLRFHIYEMAHDFGGTWLYNDCNFLFSYC